LKNPAGAECQPPPEEQQRHADEAARTQHSVDALTVAGLRGGKQDPNRYSRDDTAHAKPGDERSRRASRVVATGGSQQRDHDDPRHAIVRAIPRCANTGERDRRAG